MSRFVTLSRLGLAMSWAATVAGLVLLATVATSTTLLAQNPTGLPRTEPFIEKHCADCHDDLTRKAGLDLISLAFNPQDEANFSIWVKVHDRIKACGSTAVIASAAAVRR